MPPISNFFSYSGPPYCRVSLLKNILVRTFSSPAAEIFLTCMQRNQYNVETTLNSVKANLDCPCITHVLKKSFVDNPQLALRFFIWAGLQSTYRHSSYMYSQACRLLEIEKNPQIVIDVVDAYRAENTVVSVKMFKVILNLCRASKDAELGLRIIRKMKEFDCRPDTVSYNVVIKLVVEKGELDAALDLMTEMGLIDLYPDMITYSTIIKGLCDAGRLGDAFGLVKVMKRHGCFQNEVVYSALLDGICMHGSLERALEFLYEMEKESGSRKPNVVTYTTVVKGFVDKGKAMDALRILEQMNDLGVQPNKVTFVTVLDGLCNQGYTDEARKIVDKICGGGLQCADLYSLLVISLWRAGKCKESENVFRMMISRGMRPNGLTSSCIIEGILAEGRVLDSFHLFDTLEKSGKLAPLDSKIYSILLAALCQENLLVEVVKVTKFMINGRIIPKSPQIEAITKFLNNSGEGALASLIENMST